MKIKSLFVKNFRHIENQIIEFGEKLTVLSGQNSTGKSSLLGEGIQDYSIDGKKTIC
jgi:predicted ATP-dependent endonuclease of OLD family